MDVTGNTRIPETVNAAAFRKYLPPSKLAEGQPEPESIRAWPQSRPRARRIFFANCSAEALSSKNSP
ncbi:MAG TPA: hypothetical protein PK297_07080, partial [Spirochaetota bacterium]|nr:hypothetical protein [Spirochaetota bacterium]